MDILKKGTSIGILCSFEDLQLRPVAMVSRRKILSRSRDDLNLDTGPEEDTENIFKNNNNVEEDVWYHKDKLYKDHIQEVLDKWESIDDEIWAKVIVMERNRRVAKAYARAPVLTVNGSEDGFDGLRIGLNGFDNPMRDQKVTDVKQLVGQGCKVKMDATGNILVKRLSRGAVFVKNTIEENAISNDILKLPSNGLLEPIDKPYKLFDMKKFQQNVNREMKRAYPDRRKLECQCISAISFVKNELDLLYSPVWIMLINVVALEMLKAKIPMGNTVTRPGVRNSSEPRKRFIASGSSDEDPYSLTPSGSSGSSGKGKDKDGNSRLPQKDKDYFGPQNWAKQHVRPDYSDDMEGEEAPSQTLPKKKGGTRTSSSPNGRQIDNDISVARSFYRISRKSENDNKQKQDDPYYCGMKARVPNFVSGKRVGGKDANSGTSGGVKNRLRKAQIQQQQTSSMPNSSSAPNLAQLPGAAPPFWWQSRLYTDTQANSHQNAQGYPIPAPMGFRSSAADIPSYHYVGRARGYQQALLNPSLTPQMAVHRPQVFRTGWE